MSTAHRRQPVEAEEDVGALRRGVAAQAARLPGLPPGDAELVATELAMNVLRHTTGGYVLYRPTGGGIELIAVDRGPGMPAAALPPVSAPAAGYPHRAGRHGGAGLGVGLAGVRRRASTFDHYSTRRGTVVLVRLRPTGPGPTGGWLWGGVNVPLGGTGESGDAWAVTADGCLSALIVDGLGHGPDAAVAARAAITLFGQVAVIGQQDLTRSPDARVTGFIGQAHQAMRGTRGGVLGMSVIDPDHGRLTYAGVGNITGRIINGPQNQHLVSRSGALGTHLAAPPARLATYSWEPGATLVLASDGIDTRWDPASYPGLLHHHPVVVAATVHRDHTRGTDDATVLVVRDTRGHEPAGGYR